MSTKEIKQQATRLGLIFARFGVALTRAQKLELIAEVRGEKNWATTAGTVDEIVDEPAAHVEPGAKRTPLTPLQLLVVKDYAEGDFAYFRYREDAIGCGDPLFEFILDEAADAQGDVDAFMGMMRAGASDMQTASDSAWAATPDMPGTAAYHPSELHDAGLTAEAVRYSDGTIANRLMARLISVDERTTADAKKQWPKLVQLVTTNTPLMARLKDALGELVADIVVHEGKVGLLLEQPLFSCVQPESDGYEVRLAKALESLQGIEASYGVKAGLVPMAATHWREQSEYAWVFIPDARVSQTQKVAAINQALTGLAESLR